jgi:cobalt-zinc-cadmium efflux system outer membrane protein
LWILRGDATSAVARLIAEQERLQATQGHVAGVERLIDILRVREREGEGSRFDRLRAEQELRDARQVATSAAVVVAETRAVLAAMLPHDTPLGRLSSAADPRQPPPALDVLLARAPFTRAELHVLEQSAERADREADAARRARLPVPTVFGGLKRADDVSGRESGSVFGLNLAIPLFDAGDREAARWAAERARIEAERSAVEEQIRAEITRASEALALRQEGVSQDQAAASDELVSVAEVAYREGEVGILELLDAVRTASRASTRSIDIRLEARLAQIALERAVGEVLWP